MMYVIAYVIAFLVFAAIDATWLMSVGAKLYKSTLGDILAPDVRYGPALAFYLMYPLGLVIFAIRPALKLGSAPTAILYGALFGLFAYGTYELTNYATLRNWTLGITAIDMAYGAAVSSIVSAIVYAFAPAVSRWFGG